MRSLAILLITIMLTSGCLSSVEDTISPERELFDDTIFIDEGFGTLDVHALDRVLEALDKIRQMGRSIGLISHIDALKERIPVQVQVTSSQGGSSKVAIVGR